MRGRDRKEGVKNFCMLLLLLENSRWIRRIIFVICTYF